VHRDEAFVPMNQKKLFLQSEGDAWFQRNLPALEAKNSFPDIDFLLSYLSPLKGENTKEKFNFLEIGCGSGHKTQFLAKNLVCDGWGIDPSAQAIKYATSKFENNSSDASYKLNFSVGTADDLTFTDNFFDFVYFGFCLYVVDRSLLSRTFAEADRVLRKGGFLGILDFDVLQQLERINKHHKDVKSFKDKHDEYFLKHGYDLVAKLSLTEAGNVGFETDPDKRVGLSLLYKP
jgi:SAM-dependent methyltransferase